MAELTPRKQQILRAVVVEHVSTAEPVASDVIAQKYELGVRSATIRNEMAEITELGLLEQPHTSAGRVPSDVGYRTFVDGLVIRPVTSHDQDRITGATREEETLKEMVTETTKMLSRLTRSLSAALTVRDGGLTLMHAALTALGPERGLLVMVLQNGHVENRLVDLPKGFTLDDLGAANEALAQALTGKKLSDVAKAKAHGIPVVRTCLAMAQGVAKDLMRGHLITEGEEYIFTQPEFVRRPDALDTLINQFEDESGIIEAIGRPVTSDGPEVSIGKENASPSMQVLTIMRQRFYVGDDEAGTLAIIGPRRMDYERNLAMLGFTADAISQTLTKLLS
jgi:heat-inducible transcriptional repressor